MDRLSISRSQREWKSACTEDLGEIHFPWSGMQLVGIRSAQEAWRAAGFRQLRCNVCAEGIDNLESGAAHPGNHQEGC